MCRLFCGSIAGVELYKGVALNATEISAVMKRTKPTTTPAASSRLGCLYRGPLLLGFDPTYNLQSRAGSDNSGIVGTPPALDPSTGPCTIHTRAQDCRARLKVSNSFHARVLFLFLFFDCAIHHIVYPCIYLLFLFNSVFQVYMVLILISLLAASVLTFCS